MRRLVLALVASLATGCAVEHPVLLDVDTTSALACIDRVDRVALAARAFLPEHRAEDALLVFDFVRTPSVPRCRPQTITDECVETGCTALPEARRCLRVPRSRIDDLEAADLDVLLVSELIDGQPQLLDDAPDGTVVVRLAIVLDGAAEDPCPAPGEAPATLPRFDPERLLGCAYSCPVVLVEESIVEIDLDPVVTGRVCDEVFVQTCAAIGL